MYSAPKVGVIASCVHAVSEVGSETSRSLSIMAQQRYSKLEFDTPQQNLDTEEESVDEDKDSVPSLSPDKPATATATVQVKTSDPSIVMTRDYYGLAETVGGNHSCLVLIVNHSNRELRDPVFYAKRGYNRIPPDSRISPESNAYCAFRKPSVAMKGTSGVLSYEYERRNGRSKRFAVMWRIPYRMIRQGSENEVALKWMDADLEDSMDAQKHTSLELYREMSRSESTNSGSTVARQVAKNGKSLHLVNPEDGAEVDATFSGNCKAIVKVDFSFPPLIQ